LVEAARPSLPELARWLPWAHERYGRSDALRFIRESASAWAEGRAFDFTVRAIEDPDTHLGNVSVWHTSRREQSGEVGYWIRADRLGEGIGTEVTARVIQIGFEELRLHRLTLRIAVGNRGSERIAEKLGFTQEGLLRKEVYIGGEWIDHTLWGLLEEEYHANRPRYTDEGWLAANP
jgi:RimJ/RimL family protein N-acetyltransferase